MPDSPYRLKSQPLIGKRLRYALITWMVVFSAATGWAIYDARNARDHIAKVASQADLINCIRTNTLLTLLIEPGLKQIDTIDYYRRHPKEREIVRKQTKKALAMANPKVCLTLPSQKKAPK